MKYIPMPKMIFELNMNANFKNNPHSEILLLKDFHFISIRTKFPNFEYWFQIIINYSNLEMWMGWIRFSAQKFASEEKICIQKLNWSCYFSLNIARINIICYVYCEFRIISFFELIHVNWKPPFNAVHLFPRVCTFLPFSWILGLEQSGKLTMAVACEPIAIL